MNIVADAYDLRSKFLHEGNYLSLNNHTGKSIPQLSPTKDGFLYQMYLDSRVKNYTWTCIDWFFKNKIDIQKI